MVYVGCWHCLSAPAVVCLPAPGAPPTLSPTWSGGQRRSLWSEDLTSQVCRGPQGETTTQSLRSAEALRVEPPLNHSGLQRPSGWNHHSITQDCRGPQGETTTQGQRPSVRSEALGQVRGPRSGQRPSVRSEALGQVRGPRSGQRPSVRSEAHGQVRGPQSGQRPTVRSEALGQVR